VSAAVYADDLDKREYLGLRNETVAGHRTTKDAIDPSTSSECRERNHITYTPNGVSSKSERLIAANGTNGNSEVIIENMRR